MKHTFKHVGTAALALTLLLSGCSRTAGQASDQEAEAQLPSVCGHPLVCCGFDGRFLRESFVRYF